MSENYKDKIITLLDTIEEKEFLRYIYVLITEMASRTNDRK
jgi:hypothetical protein